MTEPIGYYPGDILRETLRQIYETLGKSLDRLAPERVVLGPAFVGIKLNNGSGGLSRLPRTGYRGSRPSVDALPKIVSSPGRLRDKKIVDYVNDVFGFNPLKKTTALAIINSLSASCLALRSPAGCRMERGADVLDEVAFPVDGPIVAAGPSPSLVSALKERGKTFFTVETDPAALNGAALERHGASSAAVKRLRQAALLIIGEKVLQDDSLERILELKKPGAETLLVGAFTSLPAGAFFRRGISALGGALVVDADRALDAAAQAEPGDSLIGKGVERFVARPLDGEVRRMERRRPEPAYGRSLLMEPLTSLSAAKL